MSETAATLAFTDAGAADPKRQDDDVQDGGHDGEHRRQQRQQLRRLHCLRPVRVTQSNNQSDNL